MVIYKSPLFAAETAENMFYNLVILNMFYNLVILFFVRKKRRGNYRRTNRSRSAAFLLSRGRVLRGGEFYAYSYEIWRGIILCVLVKLWREILKEIPDKTFEVGKKILKIGIFVVGVWQNPRRSVLLFFFYKYYTKRLSLLS